MPAFTALWLDLKPLLVVLPVAALLYCGVVWVRRTQTQPAGVGFFAGTMAGLVGVSLPTMIASYLPVVVFLEQSAAR